MLEEYENNKKKQVTRMKSIKDYSMGVLISLLGVFFIFHDQFKMPIGNDESSTMEKVFGGMCILYGGWRIYRGYKKNYFG
jgi:hypothetical protein